ncbi:MAG: ribonuclease H-like domain-containing protein [Patescibacteria group bacterium]
MRNEAVLDIETQNTFRDVGKYDPALLKISLVGVYFYETDSFEAFREHELSKLWPRLERLTRVIGYNIDDFDLPVMNSYYPGDITRLPTLDILAEIEKKVGFRVKLDDVVQATLGTAKSGNGLMAVEYFRTGEWDKLQEYCLQDVRVTRDLYEHGLKAQTVRFKDRMGKFIDVPVNFALEAPVRAAMNLTMPF